MLGISVAKVKHSIGRLVRQGRLKESAKKHDITDQTEKVYQAVVDGIQVRIVEYLGMKKPDVYYALKKLEKDGRIRCINGYGLQHEGASAPCFFLFVFKRNSAIFKNCGKRFKYP